MTRRRIGRENGIGHRSRLYMADDAFDVDDLEGYRRIRRRIFFDDVLMVTLHRERSVIDWVGGLGGSFVAMGLLLAAVATAMTGGVGAAIGAALWGLVAVLVGALSLPPLVRGRIVVAIFGRRTMGRASFQYRHARALEVYSQIVSRVQAVQARMARRAQAVEPPIDPPPSDDPVPE